MTKIMPARFYLKRFKIYRKKHLGERYTSVQVAKVEEQYLDKLLREAFEIGQRTPK